VTDVPVCWALRGGCACLWVDLGVGLFVPEAFAGDTFGEIGGLSMVGGDRGLLGAGGLPSGGRGLGCSASRGVNWGARGMSVACGDGGDGAAT